MLCIVIGILGIAMSRFSTVVSCFSRPTSLASSRPTVACPAEIHNEGKLALMACAALNHFGMFPGKRMGMIDSGCNELIIKLDEHSRKHAFEWDTNDRVTGSAAAGSFTTDGTARINIAMEFDDFQNQTKTLRVSTTAILCAGFQWDLFPTRWFQNLGHSVILKAWLHCKPP